jgi:hypothetical protein
MTTDFQQHNASYLQKPVAECFIAKSLTDNGKRAT